MNALQLPLGVELPQTATLEGFVGTTNAGAHAAVKAAIAGRNEQLYLHGSSATGKTHLLQAACRAVADRDLRSTWVPLGQLGAQAAPLLSGMQTLDCLCLDDVGAIAGQRETEIALVGLIDGLRASGGNLLIADRYPVAELSFALPDLASRLGWGSVHALTGLDDDDKEQLLMQRAAQRGMRLPPATARYLLRHGARDIPGLMTAIAELDTASLAAKRRLTIPFVRETLMRSGV